jgi:hypothetical protein
VSWHFYWEAPRISASLCSWRNIRHSHWFNGSCFCRNRGKLVSLALNVMFLMASFPVAVCCAHVTTSRTLPKDWMSCRVTQLDCCCWYFKPDTYLNIK